MLYRARKSSHASPGISVKLLHNAAITNTDLTTYSRLPVIIQENQGKFFDQYIPFGTGMEVSCHHSNQGGPRQNTPKEETTPNKYI